MEYTLKDSKVPKSFFPFLRHLSLRPKTDGKLWQFCLYLLPVFIIQATILPKLTGPYLIIDMITPWLTIYFVRQKFLHTAVLAIVAGTLLETYSSLPAGLYICTYWIAGGVIYLIRDSLSWRQRSPWLLTIFFVAVWATGFEAFVASVTVSEETLSVAWIASKVGRIAVSTAIGMHFCGRTIVEISTEERIK